MYEGFRGAVGYEKQRGTLSVHGQTGVVKCATEPCFEFYFCDLCVYRWLLFLLPKQWNRYCDPRMECSLRIFCPVLRASIQGKDYVASPWRLRYLRLANSEISLEPRSRSERVIITSVQSPVREYEF